MEPLQSGRYTKARYPGDPPRMLHSLQLEAFPIPSHETLPGWPSRASAIRLRSLYLGSIRGIPLLSQRAGHSSMPPSAMCPEHHRPDRCFDRQAFPRIAPDPGVPLLLPRIRNGERCHSRKLSSLGARCQHRKESLDIGSVVIQVWGNAHEISTDTHVDTSCRKGCIQTRRYASG
jgi:hypothetical protein